MPQPAIEVETRTLAIASRSEDGALAALARVADNAMQQYRKTRPTASKCAVANSKALRLSELHPLFIGYQCVNSPARESAFALSAHTGSCSLGTRLAAYRPNQSILEMGLTTAKDESACQEAAKIFRDTVVRRRALQDARVKSAALASKAVEVVPGNPNEACENEELVAAAGDDDKFDRLRKRRPSKAERKALKSGRLKVASREKISNLKSLKARAYIKYGNVRAAEVDDLLGDHRKKDDSALGAGAAMLESALLDIAPDEAIDMVRKRSMYRWDSRKRKYTKSTVADLLDGIKQRGNKKLKTESGIKVSDTVAVATSGELYRKWRDKGKSSSLHTQPFGIQQQGNHRSYNRVESRKESKKDTGPCHVKCRLVKGELRNANEIAKQRQVRAKIDLKNLSKAKRRKLASKSCKHSDTRANSYSYT
jgi:hypothetical protein